MRKYELTYLISDDVQESELNKVTGKINGYVDSLGGKVLKEEIWGRRKLAYPIKKLNFATYVTLNFDLPPEKAIELERNIGLSSKVVRHLMIVKDFGEEELILTSADIVQTEDIEAVVGGEKSFEAIEGETEESKNLMLKREKEEDTATERVSTSSEEKIKSAGIAKKTELGQGKEAEKQPKEKTVIKKTLKSKKKEAENEADRLSKLDKELDDILGEEL